MKFLIFIFSVVLTVPAFAKLETRLVDYQQGDVTLQGYLASDTQFKGKRPGVLVVHEWMGLNDNAKRRANMLAAMGYIAFAADIYGKGVRPKDGSEAAKMSSGYKANPELLRARVIAGLNTLKAQKNVATDKIAAIGFCFGGTTVLELARSGTPLNGVVSFHGGLASKAELDQPGIIHTKVLALHGADDPYVKHDEVDGFIKEMQKAKADWELVYLGNAVHGFSVLDAGDNTASGYAYSAQADKRAWQDMQDFLKEIF